MRGVILYMANLNARKNEMDYIDKISGSKILLIKAS